MNNGIGDFVIRIHNEDTYSASKAAEILGVSIDQIAKSILFINEENEPILVIVGGNKKVNQTKLAKQLGFKKLRLANKEEVLSHTGYEAGGLPPLGHSKQIKTYMDSEILNKKKVYAGGGSPNATLEIDPKIIRSLTNAIVIEIP